MNHCAKDATLHIFETGIFNHSFRINTGVIRFETGPATMQR